MSATIQLPGQLEANGTQIGGFPSARRLPSSGAWLLLPLALALLACGTTVAAPFETEINPDGMVTITGGSQSLALPRDFGAASWRLEEFGDSRPSNVKNPTPTPPRLLQSMGTSSMPNGSIVNSGPLFSNQNFPYVMLDAKRNVLLMHPEPTKAACVGFAVGCPGRYRFAGAFARANNSWLAGDGVDVAIFVNADTSHPVFQSHIASHHSVNADDPFGGGGVARFDLALDLAEGDILRFAVFCGPEGGDMSFDVTAFEVNVSLPMDVQADGTAAGDESRCPCGDLEIPETIDGRKVARIRAGAFSDCPDLTDVSIPDTVIDIGDAAFAGCIGLTRVTIGSGLQSLGADVFSGCTNLAEAYLNGPAPDISRGPPFGPPTTIQYRPETMGWGPTFGGRPTVPRWPENAFAVNPDGTATITAGCVAGELTLPSTIDGRPVSTIASYAFDGCTSLNRITIPNSVTRIEEYAFFGCRGLTSITIPNSVTSIGVGVFGECSSLAGITIPNRTTTIGEGAFAGCTRLAGVRIPNSVTNIGDWAFFECTQLVDITIPGSVTGIGRGAFLECSNLIGAYFEGDAPVVPAVGGVSPGPSFGAPTTVYHLSGAGGWGPTFGGRPTAPWLAPGLQILTRGTRFGPGPAGFGFIISWETNAPVVVEASTDAVSDAWTPVLTNDFTVRPLYFSDPRWTNQSALVYRVRSMAVAGNPPWIREQPRDQTLVSGETARFSVAAAGDPPLALRWERSSPEGAWGQIPDATSDHFVLPDVQASQAGGYRVVVSNDLGAITSRVAVLQVKKPQTLTWVSPDPATSLEFGQGYPLQVISSSGLPVAFRIESGPAILTKGAVTLTGIGQVTVAAEQAGDAMHAPATLQRTFNRPDVLVTDPPRNLTGDATYSFVDMLAISVRQASGRYELSVENAAPFPGPADIGQGHRADIIWFVDADRNRATGQSADGNDYNIHLYLDSSGWHWFWYKVSAFSSQDGVQIRGEDFRIRVQGSLASLSFPTYYLPLPTFDLWATCWTYLPPSWPPLAANPNTARATFVPPPGP